MNRLESIRADLGAAILAERGAGDDLVLQVRTEDAHETLRTLKERHGFNILVDLTAVDRSRLPDAASGARFEVVYRLLALDPARGLAAGRIAVALRVDEVVPRSVMDLWPAADWLEREIWDMFGVRFGDREGIKRLLMYEEFKGHALRKDYPIHKRQPLIGPADGEPRGNPSFNHEVPTVTAD